MADLSSKAAASAWKRLNGCRDCVREKERRERSEMMERNLSVQRREVFEWYYGSPPDGKIDKELWSKHWRQIRESEGFDIKDFPQCKLPAFIRFTAFGVDSRPYELAKIALEKYNFLHNKQYELVRVITVNAQLAAGYIYYITLEARKTGADPTNDPLVTFQARVWDSTTPPVPEVQLCRIKNDHRFYLLGIHLSWWQLMITLLIAVITYLVRAFW